MVNKSSYYEIRFKGLSFYCDESSSSALGNGEPVGATTNTIVSGINGITTLTGEASRGLVPVIEAGSKWLGAAGAVASIGISAYNIVHTGRITGSDVGTIVGGVVIGAGLVLAAPEIAIAGFAIGMGQLIFGGVLDNVNVYTFDQTPALTPRKP